MWPPPDLDSSQIEAFHRYRELLIREGSRLNLTALREPAAIERRHFGESLALVRALEKHAALGSPVIDIGSGAGFPGLAMKIARPALQVTLLDATGKKAAFLELAVRELGLSGVTVVNGRAEEVAHEAGHRAGYELAVARAVAPLRILVELSLGFVRAGGHLAAPKGSGAPREVREASSALGVLGGEVVAVERLDVEGPGTAPVLVLVKKTGETPDAYPRRPGIPVKRPL